MKKILMSILLLLPFMLSAQVPGKRESRYGFDINVKPPIYYTTFLEYNDSVWQPELNITLRVQNDLLQFVKTGDQYSAEYEVLLTVLSQPGDSVLGSEVWRETVQLNDFAETNSKLRYQSTGKTISLPRFDQKLNVDLEVTDLGNSQSYRNRRSPVFQELDQPDLRVGPMTFFTPGKEIPSEIHLSTGDPILEFNSDHEIRFSVSSNTLDPINVIARLIRDPEKQDIEIFKTEKKYRFSSDYFSVNDTLSKRYLEEGNYALIYEFSAGKIQGKLEKKFEVIWYNKPVYLYKFDLALRPMRYILPGDLWKEVDDMSYSDQERWFDEYWKKQDPSPQTPFNEIAYEFFSRVDDANQEFSLRFLEGWETDRGKALILYGQPDRQEKKAYLTNSNPYEIWFYDSLKQKLTFVDIDNDANYKLVAVEDLMDSDNE